MINKEAVIKILERSINAPSGDNSQPWRFEVKGSVVYLYSIPERDVSMYNYKQRGSLVAHGALLENISIVSSRFGYQAKIDLFPKNEGENCTASITFEKSESVVNSLGEFIKDRSTNRRLYKKEPLSSQQRNEILFTAEEVGGVNIVLVEDGDKKELLGKVASLNEKLILENQYIHDILFSTLIWTEEEEKKKKMGMYAHTLELKPPQMAVFKLLKSWPFAKFMTKLGFPKVLQKESSNLYASCSAIGAILIKDSSKENFIATGRALERIWLKAIKNGLSLQPITAIPYLYQKVSEGNMENLSQQHADLIKEAYKKMEQIFNSEGKLISMVFRIGDGGKPNFYSSKLPVEIVVNY